MPHYRIDDPNNRPPRDGTLIDLWTSGDRVANASWNHRFSQWEYLNPHGVIEKSSDAAFTHWSPIVPPGDEPQESMIRWHGPEVAATWPRGSMVLTDNLSWLSLLTWRSNSHRWLLHPEYADWRYALIKRGGDTPEATAVAFDEAWKSQRLIEFPLDIKRGGPFDHIAESMKRR